MRKELPKAVGLALATTATAAMAMPFDLPTMPWIVNRFVEWMMSFVMK